MSFRAFLVYLGLSLVFVDSLKQKRLSFRRLNCLKPSLRVLPTEIPDDQTSPIVTAESPSEDIIVTLEALYVERERRRRDLLTSELAITKLERNLSKSDIRVTASPDDYGFVSKSAKGETISGVPPSSFKIGLLTFKREFLEIFGISDSPELLQKSKNRLKLKELKLSNEAIWAREKSRPQVVSPLVIKIPYLILCVLLDALFDGDPISRFWFLETVARMPYFSYITLLHSYETLGDSIDFNFPDFCSYVSYLAR